MLPMPLYSLTLRSDLFSPMAGTEDEALMRHGSREHSLHFALPCLRISLGLTVKQFVPFSEVRENTILIWGFLGSEKSQLNTSYLRAARIGHSWRRWLGWTLMSF